MESVLSDLNFDEGIAMPVANAENKQLEGKVRRTSSKFLYILVYKSLLTISSLLNAGRGDAEGYHLQERAARGTCGQNQRHVRAFKECPTRTVPYPGQCTELKILQYSPPR